MKADKGHTEVKADGADDNLITYVFNSAKFFTVNFVKMTAISECGTLFLMLFLMFVTGQSFWDWNFMSVIMETLSFQVLIPPVVAIWLLDMGLFFMGYGVIQKDVLIIILLCTTFGYRLYCYVLLALDTRGGVKCGVNFLLTISAILVVMYMIKYNHQFRDNMLAYLNAREFFNLMGDTCR